MALQADHVTVALVEHDPSGKRLSWVFPAQGDMDVAVIAARAQLSEDKPLSEKVPTFAWSRWRSQWYYTLARERKPTDQPDVVHAAVSRFAIVLGSPLFDPERYHSLLQVLLRAFEGESGSPLALLQRVLSMSTKGSASAPLGPDFVASKFDAAAARLACPLGQTLRALGTENAATLWAAMLLRARIAVYHPGGVGPLLSLVRCLPLLAWHRPRWEGTLRGLCSLSEAADLADLEQAGSLAAGFVEPEVLDMPQLYDVLIDARPAKGGGGDEVTLKLMPSAAGLAPPPKVRKQIGKVLDSMGEGVPTIELVEALAAKTAEFLEKAAEVAAMEPDEADASLPEGVGPFLRRLNEADGVGAGS